MSDIDYAREQLHEAEARAEAAEARIEALEGCVRELIEVCLIRTAVSSGRKQGITEYCVVCKWSAYDMAPHDCPVARTDALLAPASSGEEKAK